MPGRAEQERRTILVVDDETSSLSPILRTLDGQYAVQGARSAQEARAFLARRIPDLVILDLVLGDDNGLNLLDELRRVSAVPVLLITGHGSEAVAVRAIQGRANAYLSKPFFPETLRAHVATLLAEGPRPEHIAERARALIDTLVEEWVTSEEIAQRLGVPHRRLLLAFRDRFGRTPMQYLREVRLQRGQLLLTTTQLPVSDIAAQVGFRDPSYFERFFKQVVGMTPATFRRTHLFPAPCAGGAPADT